MHGKYNMFLLSSDENFKMIAICWIIANGVDFTKWVSEWLSFNVEGDLRKKITLVWFFLLHPLNRQNYFHHVPSIRIITAVK